MNSIINFPLAPEKLTVSNDMLSKYCKGIAGRYKLKVGDVKKLIPNMCFITEIFNCICR